MGRSVPTLYEQTCDEDWVMEQIGGTRRRLLRTWMKGRQDGLDGRQDEDSSDGKLTSSDIQEYLDDQKEYVKSCWTTPNFNFENIEQPNGSMRSFHFLECTYKTLSASLFSVLLSRELDIIPGAY